MLLKDPFAFVDRAFSLFFMKYNSIKYYSAYRTLLNLKFLWPVGPDLRLEPHFWIRQLSLLRSQTNSNHLMKVQLLNSYTVRVSWLVIQVVISTCLKRACFASVLIPGKQKKRKRNIRNLYYKFNAQSSIQFAMFVFSSEDHLEWMSTYWMIVNVIMFV